MIQYNYKLNWTEGETGLEKKLDKVLQTLSMRPTSKQANAIFIQLSFHNVPASVAVLVREKIHEHLPRAVVAGMTETLMLGIEKSYVCINCSFFQTAKLRLMEYNGRPADFRKLGVEYGQKVAAMRDVRAALILGTMTSGFSRFVQGFVCGNENVVVFGGLAGTYERLAGDSAMSSSIFVMDKGRDDLSQFIMSSEPMRDGIVVVAFCGESLSVRADYVLGWKPVGKEMVVSDTVGNNGVGMLAGMPAVDVYRHYLGVRPDENFIFNIAEFPFIIERNECQIARVAPGYDEEGRIFFSGDVHAGEKVRLSYAVREEFLHETELASEKMGQFAPEGLFLQLCGTRALFLQGQEHEEARYYQRIANQFNACSSTGEIYCYQGQGGVLNCALVAVGFREGRNKSALSVFDYEAEPAISEDSRIPLAVRMAAFLDAMTRELADTNRDLQELAVKNEQQSIAKYKFLAGVSREIGEPLRNVRELERRIQHESSEPHVQALAKKCHMDGEKVYTVLNRLFDFLEMEAGNFVINEAEYRVSDLIAHLRDEVQDEAEAKGLDFSLELPADMPSILYGDELRLQQIMANLLSSSIKYTEHGFIHMKVTAEKDGSDEISIHVSIKDSGIGIPPEANEEVQKALAMEDDSHLNMLSDTGMGLNVTQRLLKCMNSALHIESQVGVGTEITFTVKQRVLNWIPLQGGTPKEPVSQEQPQAKPCISPEELAETWEALGEIATEQDKDSLTYMLETLEGYILPELEASLLLELHTAAAEDNWPRISQLVIEKK